MTAELAANAAVVCAPWCTDGDGHPEEVFRADQNCMGPQRKVALGLESGAPPLPMVTVPFDAPGLTVYPHKRWHDLAHVRLNVYRQHENPHLSVDVDLDVTAAEARQLARYLLEAADQVDGSKR